MTRIFKQLRTRSRMTSVGRPRSPSQAGVACATSVDLHKKSFPTGFTLHMKPARPLLVALAVSLALPLWAEDAKPLLNRPGKVITQPDLKQSLGAEWSVGKGKWEPAEGLLAVTDIPDEKHIPVLHLATGPTPLIWECEFLFNNGKSFLVGCDSAGHHVGRVVIGPKSFKICEDSTEVKGKTPSHTLAETPVDLKPDAWTPCVSNTPVTKWPRASTDRICRPNTTTSPPESALVVRRSQQCANPQRAHYEGQPIASTAPAAK